MPSASDRDAALVLPTYNERENVETLIASLLALPISLHIVIVDDNSPDGTGELADGLAARSGNVEVIHRSGKLGLGTAYAAGFARALSQGVDRVFTMDADFSHHPRYLPAMYEASNKFDLVIGSRYVSQGGVRDWGFDRKALSWGANTIVHLALGLRARDCTAGFRCYHRRVLETIRPETIRANGYSYLIEMLFRCQQAGFTIGEVPIIFTDRQLGQSKISRGEIAKAMMTVGRLLGHRVSGTVQLLKHA